jgi:hypothetical protein
MHTQYTAKDIPNLEKGGLREAAIWLLRGSRGRNLTIKEIQLGQLIVQYLGNQGGTYALLNKKIMKSQIALNILPPNADA